MTKLTKLLKYAELKPTEITPDVLTEVASSFGWTVQSEENLATLAEVVRSDCPDTIADWLVAPGNFAKAKATITGPAISTPKSELRTLVVCPGCGICFDNAPPL
jgi:hypothetical protein